MIVQGALELLFAFAMVATAFFLPQMLSAQMQQPGADGPSPQQLANLLIGVYGTQLAASLQADSISSAESESSK